MVLKKCVICHTLFNTNTGRPDTCSNRCYQKKIRPEKFVPKKNEEYQLNLFYNLSQNGNCHCSFCKITRAVNTKIRRLTLQLVRKKKQVILN